MLCDITLFCFLPGPSWQVEKGVCYIPSVAGILLSISVDCFHPNSIATLSWWTDLPSVCGTESVVPMTGVSYHINVCHPVTSRLHSKCFWRERKLIVSLGKWMSVFSVNSEICEWCPCSIKTFEFCVMKIGMCSYWGPCITCAQK